MKVLVSGCFDLFHSGHIQFLEVAAEYGDLYVSVGSDATIRELKREPIYTQEERLYFVKSLKCVKDAFIATGSGLMDFEPELRAMRPDVFVVNYDGSTAAKEALCAELGIRYVAVPRTTRTGLPTRTTTGLLKELKNRK